MTRTMTRALGSLVIGPVIACGALVNGCVSELATIDLVVHESANEALRRTTPGNGMTLKYILDEVRAGGGEGARVVDGLSFDDDPEVDAPAQRLKPYAQRMTMALGVGRGTGFALGASLAVGRVDPLLVPSLDDDGTVALDARAFLAQPDTLELVDEFTPAGGPQALCDNRAGYVHAVGGLATYSFNLEQLALRSNNAGFSTEGDPIIACDVADVVVEGEVQDAEGIVVAAHGICDGAPTDTYTLVINVGPEQLTLLDQEGKLCDPFVRIVTLESGALRIWVAAREFAALYAFNDPDFADGQRLDRAEFVPFLTGPVRHVLLKDGTLIAGGTDPNDNPIGSIVPRIADNALPEPVPTTGLLRMIAGDPSGEAALFEEGDPDDGVFTLFVPNIGNNNVVTPEDDPKTVAFAAGFTPTRILVINGDDDDRGNDVVVGMNDAGDVQIEGGELKTGTQRNGFALAFGRAIILAGNVEGHDVLVRSFSDAEVDLFSQVTRN